MSRGLLAHALITITTLAGVNALGGCALHRADTQIAYKRGAAPPPLLAAPAAGDYVLYPAEGSSITESVATVPLAAGDRYGFLVKRNGEVVAVAKGEEIALPARFATGYYWKRKNE